MTRALVLRTIRYGDNRLVVSLFTENYGMVTCMVRVARGRKSGGRAALWQVLNLVDVTIDFRPSRDMQTVKDASMSCPWQDLPYHPVKAAISMFLGDFLVHALRGEGENATLFAFVKDSLRWFDETDEGIVDFHLQLMLRLTRFLGILPGVDGYARYNIYDLRGACYVALIPGHGQYLAADEAKWIPLLLRLDYGRMRKLKMTTAKRRRMMEVLLLYYRLHLPAFGELQSLDVLRDIFS